MELGKSTGTNEEELKTLKMPRLKRQRASCNYAQKPPLAPKKRRKLAAAVVPVLYIDDEWWDARMTDVHFDD